MPTPITAIEAAPIVPDSSKDEPIFDLQQENFYKWEAEKLAPGANALGAATFNNATEAQASATAAAASAATAQASAATSLAGSKFIGDWAGKTGQQLRPASAAHIGRIWMLLADLPNIEAAEPAEGSPYWRAYDSVLPVIPVTTAYAELISGKEYSVLYTGGQVTLKMPPPGIGGAVVIDIANKRTDLVLLHNGGLFMDELALDDYMLVDPGRYAARHNGVSWRGLA